KKKLTIIANSSERASHFFAILSKVNVAVRNYVVVKSQMSILTGLVSYFILLLFEVDFPVLWAFLIFLLNFIPYIGSIVATFLPATFAVFQFHSFSIFFWIMLSVGFVQVLVGNVV